MEDRDKFPGEKDIHANRCKGDPIYKLCFFPQEDGFSREFVQRGIEYIHKRYGSAIRNDVVISRIFGLLQTIDDEDARFMAIIFMCVWESQLKKVMEEYFSMHTSTIFGIKSKECYRDFMVRVDVFVRQTIHSNYNPTNIIEIVRNFKSACIQTYMIGGVEEDERC